MNKHPLPRRDTRKLKKYFWKSMETTVRSLTPTWKKLSPCMIPGIREDLVRTDAKWKEWDFGQLVEALKGWVERNPIYTTAKPLDDGSRKREKASKLYQVPQKKDQERPSVCCYCDSTEHKSSNCSVVKTPGERKQVLAKKRLYYNCTVSSRRAAECRSTATCQFCAERHHTSICASTNDGQTEGFMTTLHPEENEVMYPEVLIEVDGMRTRNLLDTGVGSSYVSAKLVEAWKTKPKEVKTKRIEMMLGATTMKGEIYSANIKSIDGELSMNVDLSKVHKPEL